MQIALLGGTGDIGEGLALRLARDTDHDVLVGSREEERARDAAATYTSTLADHGIDADIEGDENPAVTAQADVVVLSVPAYYLADTIEAVADDLGDAVLVSPAVGMQRDEAGVHYNPPGVGSVTELAAGAAPEDVPVVGAFHNLAAGALADLETAIDWDVPVVGNDVAAKETVIDLADGIDGLRALDAGALGNAAEVESLTPLLINLATNNDGLHDLGVKFW
jgi:NADPH-dependent F420 reductase